MYMHQVEKVVRTIKGAREEVDIIFCVGYLTANPPEIIEINGGYKVMRKFGFSLKVPTGKGNSVKFYPLEIWGIQAEYMKELGFEGQQLIVTGRLNVSTYNGKTNTTLSVERFSCITRKEEQTEVSPELLGNQGERITQDEDLEVEAEVLENYGDLPF